MDSPRRSVDSIGDPRDVPRKIFHRRAVLSVDNAPPIPAKAIDISSLGMSVIIDRPLAEGRKCSIRVNVILGNIAGQVKFECSVLYSVLVGTEGFRIGLRFVQLDSKTSDLIKQIMQDK